MPKLKFEHLKTRSDELIEHARACHSRWELVRLRVASEGEQLATAAERFLRTGLPEHRALLEQALTQFNESTDESRRVARAAWEAEETARELREAD